jgi:rubrerythrin
MKPQNWHLYFKRNAARRKPIPWHLGVQVEAHWREPLIHTLQRFQLGESGEGTFLKQWARQANDEDFMAAIDLFVKEEQNHSHMMACLLRELDAPLLDGHWSDNLFVVLRRIGGLKFEIMIFLVAEVIAKRFFRALYDGSTDPLVRAIFGQIVREERAHVAFNCQALSRFCEPLSAPEKWAMRALWRVMFRLTCLLVMFDHRTALRAAGVGNRQFWNEVGSIFNRDMAKVFPRQKPVTCQQSVPVSTT